MGQNHSTGGDWHGGIKENCPKCTPIAKPVAEPVEIKIEDKKPKKKVGV